MDPGESLEECCRRAVWKETGLIVRVVLLIGIYSTPHRVTYDADGHRWQTVSATFLTAKTGVSACAREGRERLTASVLSRCRGIQETL
jgi:ADP-ribose pyrophosphatase YjhB (NUDIX family)